MLKELYNLNVERNKLVNGVYEGHIKQLIEFNSKQAKNEKLKCISFYVIKTIREAIPPLYFKLDKQKKELGILIKGKHF